MSILALEAIQGEMAKETRPCPKVLLPHVMALGTFFVLVFFPFIATLLPVQAAALSRSEMGALAASRHYMLGGTSPA